jgi:hypothetical protein
VKQRERLCEIKRGSTGKIYKKNRQKKKNFGNSEEKGKYRCKIGEKRDGLQILTLYKAFYKFKNGDGDKNVNKNILQTPAEWPPLRGQPEAL